MPAADDILIEEAFTQTRMTRGTFMRLFGYVSRYRRTFILNLVFTIVATISQLLGPKFIQTGIDRYLVGSTTAEAAYRGILIISGMYLANLLLGWGLSVVQVKSAISVGQGALNAYSAAFAELFRQDTPGQNYQPRRHRY
jgi:ABC-type multidrug transport system fused ATPase/permease subunit